jgi:hypothetical protein
MVEPDNVATPAGKANDHFASTPAGTGFSLTATPSNAVGTTADQSAFGNPANSTGPDLYTFRYTPGTDADNTTYAAGTVLGSKTGFPGQGNTSSGLTGGASGTYRVYFTVPSSGNVDASGSNFTITQNGAAIVINGVNLNNGGTGDDTDPGATFVGGANNAWWLLGEVTLTAGVQYTVSEQANSPTFVSQRAHGVMWEMVPEPTSLGIFALAGLGLVGRRRRV